MLPERQQWKRAVHAAAVMLRTPPSTASHRRASHAHFPYTVRNFENVTGQQRAQTPPSRPFALCRHIAGWTQACNLFALCCHSNATRAPIADSPNSAQLRGSLYRAPKLHPGLCSSVGVRPRTDRQTHRRGWPQYILRRLWLMQTVTTKSTPWFTPSSSSKSHCCWFTLSPSCHIIVSCWFTSLTVQHVLTPLIPTCVTDPTRDCLSPSELPPLTSTWTRRPVLKVLDLLD